MQLVKALLLLPMIVCVDACAEAGAHCGLGRECCGGSRCKRQGFLNWRCEEQCVAEGTTCGGPDLEQRSCCHGLTCKRHLLGTANMQCVRAEPQCIRPGQICGCVGCLTQRCCGGAQCLGADKKYCVHAHMASFAEEDNMTVRAEDEALAVEEQCVAEGKTCGGPDLEQRSCCHGMTCKRHLLGTANMQCVRAEPQCIRPGQICGCVGCLTQRCCGGAQCLGADKKYCVHAHMASFAEEDNVTVRAEDEALAVEENRSGLAEFLP